MRYFITGAGGFVGSHVADRLLADGHHVVGYDNFSTGQRRFLEPAGTCERFTAIEDDTLAIDRLAASMAGCEFVFHLAANADVRRGVEHPRRDLEQNTLATFNVLEAMRRNGIARIAFTSTGSIYGDATTQPTPEDAPFPIQTSLYGASKLAGEGLIQAYCAGFGFQAYIFRLVSVVGERYSHGHVFDFYQRLRATPTTLPVLGNGLQRKSYLYVADCIEAMLTAIERAPDRVNVFNLGAGDYCRVNESIDWITGHLGLDPVRSYSGGDRGWVGDSPFIFLDTTKIRALGWTPKVSIRDGIIRTLDYLRANPWLMDGQR